MPAKILIADDHPIVREGILKLVSSAGMEVVGYVDSAANIIESIDKLKPSILVTEVRLGGQDALKTLEKLENPECRVVVFSSYSNPTNIARSASLGCHDFILKTSAGENLINAIECAYSGASTPQTSLLIQTRTRMRSSSPFANESPLTNRETQVLRHVSMGLSNREVGKSLGISVETVKEHVQNILRKLDVNDRTQAAVWAVKNDLIID